MGAVHADISVSLDGFVAPPGGWLNGSEACRAIAGSIPASAGALVTSHRAFLTHGAHVSRRVPAFVLVDEAPPPVDPEEAVTFVADGIADAVALAKAAAGERDVHVLGGPDVVGQALAARLVDELHVHVAPLILGAGTRLFGDDALLARGRTTVVATEAAPHLTFRIAR